MGVVWQLRVVHAIQYASGDCTHAESTDKLAPPSQRLGYKGAKGHMLACLGWACLSRDEPTPALGHIVHQGVQKGKLPPTSHPTFFHSKCAHAVAAGNF